MLSSICTARRVVKSRQLLLSRISSSATATPLTACCRRFATVATNPQSGETKTSALRLSVPSERRENLIGVQQLPLHVRDQLFTSDPPEPDPELFELAKKHLQQHDLFGKANDESPPISFDLPRLRGKTLDEHFHKLGREASEPYLQYAKNFAAVDLPESPKKWEKQSGWTKYNSNGTTEKVDHPDEKMLVFDVEVLYKESPFAIMACAASQDAWYAWLSPWLLGESESDRQLIPLGNPEEPRIVVGHNIGYDRARISEEYNIKQTKNSFLDTMSLHVAVNGMCSQQRPTWMKHAKNKEKREKMVATVTNPDLTKMLGEPEEEEELWVGRSSINSLRDVAKFHCNITIDKSVRDHFGTLDKPGVLENLNMLLDYCAADVAVSHKVYKAILPHFLQVCPHPVSFAALRHLASVTLPVNRSWKDYIANAEATYKNLAAGVSDRLIELANTALASKDDLEKCSTDPWLSQLDWTVKEVRMTKARVTKAGVEKVPSRPVANQKMPGVPQWYKDLHPKAKGPINLTVRTRIAPLLLRMSWDRQPLVWSDKFGWTFRVTPEEAKKYEGTPVVRVNIEEEEKNLALRNDTNHVYFKIPHKDGPQARCAAPLAKGYLQYFESETLSSEYPLAREALDMNAMCSYWISARERIKSQMVVYESDVELGVTASKGQPDLGIILPQIIPMGTITRRAVERTWLTAANAKKNRVGSELKAMVTAPPGYVFVGADVDSEELWIASLVGDAQFKLHGGGALGFMTLEGSKAAGTDLHSKTASILGISRNSAKVFNYGRIYGAGVKFASTLLRQFNPRVTDAEAIKTAQKLYHETKGVKTTRALLTPQPFWRGGTESLVFNKLEEFAEQDKPQTPVLGATITEALMQQYISKGAFLTSRINWAIQSSGVDYLHLLLISMDYLIRLYGLKARLAITVHDEIRYLVKEEHKYKLALALQVANVWTRAMFSQQMGIEDLPQSCAWFSAVDIDTVLRKEVFMNCITPSHPEPIPPGESIDIQTLLSKDSEATLDEAEGTPIDLDHYEYTPRQPIMETLGKKRDQKEALWMLRAQIAGDDKELNQVMKEVRANEAKKKAAKNEEEMLRLYREPELNLPATDIQTLKQFMRGVISSQSKKHISGKDRKKPIEYTFDV
ncbi:hypothetical protein K440DRAFT_578589 [Wilcoxina mikolae CBS 423.85]|nr:hypothetical protein K440DRAFT_578589 [Wilcoxina mikolae CBS 423.85]